MKIDHKTKTIIIDDPKEAGWLLQNYPLSTFYEMMRRLKIVCKIRIEFPKLSELKDDDVVSRFAPTDKFIRKEDVVCGTVSGKREVYLWRDYKIQFNHSGWPLELCVGRGLWIPVDVE